MAEALRRVAFPVEATGAAYLRWPDGSVLPPSLAGRTVGILVVARQSVRFNQGALNEVGTTLHVGVVPSEGEPIRVESATKGSLIRALLRAVIRREPAQQHTLVSRLECELARWVDELRRPTDAEREDGVRHAVTPLLAAVVG